MAAGDVTPGRRITTGELPQHEWPAGAYGLPDCDEPSWHCVTPNGRLGNLRGHQVTEHDDGTITVQPSILVQRPGTDDGWHGYLERGVWREV